MGHDPTVLNNGLGLLNADSTQILPAIGLIFLSVVLIDGRVGAAIVRLDAVMLRRHRWI